MSTKAELEAALANAKRRTDTRLLLIFAMVVVSLGLFMVMANPFIVKYLHVEYKDLDIGSIPAMASGWAIVGVGGVILFIWRAPAMVAAWRTGASAVTKVVKRG